MHSSDKVLVIAVNGSPGKQHPGELRALPAPPNPREPPLPSEVKYSASLVRGLGWTHFALGLVLFILGILGTWAEPETTWSGTGVWGGLVAMICGLTGLVAHKLWYKNYSIKAFLVASVSTVLVCLLALGITLYSIIYREERFLRLLEEAKKNPWFASVNPDSDLEHQRPTLNVSINQVVGFVLELLLAAWSTKVAWRGVRASEFSSSQREAMMVSQQEKQLQLYQQYQQQYAAAAAGPQIPLAALYQLLQAHPELLGVKAGMNNSGWVEDLEKQRTSSMDYHERVDRYLANTDNRPPSSTLHNDSLDHSASTASTSGETSSESGGRGSPSNSAETVVCTNARQNVSHRTLNDVASVDLSESAVRCNKQNKRETKSRPAPKPCLTPNSTNENTIEVKIPSNNDNKQKFDSSKDNISTPEKSKEKKIIKKNIESDGDLKTLYENEDNMDIGIKIRPSDIKRAIVVEDFNVNEEATNLVQDKTYKVLTRNTENQSKVINDKDFKNSSKSSEKILSNKEINTEMLEKTNDNSECANMMSRDTKDKVTHIDAKPVAHILENQSGDNIVVDKKSPSLDSLTEILPPSQFCDK